MATDLDNLVERLAIYRRNGTAVITVRSWRSGAKPDQVAALRRAKREGCCSTCDAAVAAVSESARLLIGPGNWIVTTVPCGHSQTPDCLGKRLARGVADALGVPFVQLWADRFLSGSSHPKEFHRLPPLEWLQDPDRPVLIVDDVVTSGAHMEEALGAVRGKGQTALGIAWIGGSVAGRDSGLSEPEGSASDIFGGGRAAGWGRGGVWGLPGRR